MWKPLSERTNSESKYEALHEGVPEWLRASLIDWTHSYFWSTGSLDQDRLLALERVIRVRLDWSQGKLFALQDLVFKVERDSELFLNAVDHIAHEQGSGHPAFSLAKLEDILSQGGSAWCVGRGPDRRPCLERRVLPEVKAGAEEVAANSGKAGYHLRAAWAAIYGRQPSPGEAYSQAVKAVEVASIPFVIPSDPLPTLGKVIRRLKDKPETLRVNLAPRKGTEPVQILISMLELLWTAQQDRHGSPNPQAPIQVNSKEAECAVHLMITLVHWFTSGCVTSI